MRIVCALDGSQSALTAGRMVAALPLTPEDEVIVLTVATLSDMSEASESSVGALEGTAAAVKAEQRQGNAADQILRFAAEYQADLIVMGHRGHSGLTRLLLGSVAERVVRHAGCSVLIARDARPPQRVVLGTDGSRDALRAAEWLRDFPLLRPVEASVVTVLPFTEDLARAYRMQFPANSSEEQMQAWIDEEFQSARGLVDATADLLSAGGIQASGEVRHGDAAQELLAAAEERGADLVVTGAAGLSAMERFFMGSVAEKVVRHADCSAAVVRGAAG